MHAAYSPTSGIVRVYEPGQGYQNRGKFVGVSSVIWLDDDKVFIFGALGRTESQILRMMKATFQELLLQGARTAQLKRAKGHRFPFGGIIEVGEIEDTWEVDLVEACKK